MSKKEKLLEKFKNKSNGITYAELKTFLSGLGYFEDNKGKSSGSRVAFINEEKKHIIRLHKPHPGNELKKYQIDLIYDELKIRGYFK